MDDTGDIVTDIEHTSYNSILIGNRLRLPCAKEQESKQIMTLKETMHLVGPRKGLLVLVETEENGRAYWSGRLRRTSECPERCRVIVKSYCERNIAHTGHVSLEMDQEGMWVHGLGFNRANTRGVSWGSTYVWCGGTAAGGEGKGGNQNKKEMALVIRVSRDERR
ncbi:hypothetical protein EDB19DRAFT_1779420 [Suillus lakei]|nr:hypothetical protein EDB19DRAFT_1779420 [Suillus lakei]